MAIKYYPNRIQKKLSPAIDYVMAVRKPQLVRGAQNTTSSALDTVISANKDWRLNGIKLTFSSSTPRDYSVKILGGRKVVSDLNDSLWFQHENSLPQSIVLSSGFYTGTELAAELESKMDANSSFSGMGLTFTVAYSAITGLFTITPSSGNIRYINEYLQIAPRYRDSIAGHLFGLTADTAFTSPVTSNETVFGLNQESWIIDETASTIEENFFDDLKIFDVDQALRLQSNTASVIVNYEVNYEEIV